MRVLITGASGFVAPHLTRELMAHGHDVVLTSRNPRPIRKRYPGTRVFACSLESTEAIYRVFVRVRPDAIVHLAGIAQTKSVRGAAAKLRDSNTDVMRRLCEALRRITTSHRPAQSLSLLFVSSGLVYGSSRTLRRFTEKDVTSPQNAYGASKLKAEQFLRRHKPPHVQAWIVRPFNHTGPGQSSAFAAPAFAARIAAARSGDPIVVGDLSSVRDFCDVRDMVSAYRLILEKRPQADLFVLGSGRAVRMKDIFQSLVRTSRKRIRPVVDTAMSTSMEVSRLVANPALARRVLGWRCRIPLRRTLRDVYREAAEGGEYHTV